MCGQKRAMFFATVEFVMLDVLVMDILVSKVLVFLYI